MNKKAVSSIGTYAAMALVALGLGACSNNRPWFEGMRDAARMQCRQADASAERECVERVNRGSYDEYEMDRQRATVTR